MAGSYFAMRPGGPDVKDVTSRPLRFTGFRVVALLLGVCIIVPACGQNHPVTPEVATSSPKETQDIEYESLNVILVTIDTLRSDRLSCYGSKMVQTPNFDGFADEGVLFRNAASAVPFTLPAHSSILTGLYPPGHGVRENVGCALGETLPTLAEMLSAEGWATAGFVSAFVLDRRWGIGRGFDHYFDDFGVTSVELPNLDSAQRSGDVTIDEAVNWLDRRPVEQPFFMWLHLYDPHYPYDPPEPYRSKHPNRPYDGEVAYTDALLGQFRHALEKRNLLEDTLVVLTADHGEGLGDHGEALHGFFVYDSTIHVPLIVRFPTADNAGRVVDAAVSHVDLVPTILDIAGLELPTPVHGQSLMPLINEDGAAPDRAVYAESLYPLLHYGFAPLRALRTQEFNLIDAPRSELFEAGSNSLEGTDIALQRPDVLRELETRLDTLRETIEADYPATDTIELDPMAIAQLQTLGYAAGREAVSVDQEGDRERADPKDKIAVHQLITRAQSRLRFEQQPTRQVLLDALEVDPEIFDAHLMLGQIAATEQRFDEARTRFAKALDLQPEHTEALMGLAGAYRFLGRNDEALITLHRLLEVEETNTGASLSIADIQVERGRLDEAARVLEHALAIGRSPSIVRNKLGELYLLQGREAEAVVLFKTAASEDETFAKPCFNLATIYEKRDDIPTAVAHYEKALELAPDYLEAQFNLGRLMGQMGQLDRQQELWEAAVEGHPDFVQGRYYLAKLLVDRGQDLIRAETLVRQGINKDSAHEAGPFGHYLLADILNRTGRRSEAVEVFARGRRIQAEMM